MAAGGISPYQKAKIELETRTVIFNSLKETLRCHQCSNLPRPNTTVFRSSIGHMKCENCVNAQPKVRSLRFIEPRRSQRPVLDGLVEPDSFCRLITNLANESRRNRNKFQAKLHQEIERNQHLYPVNTQRRQRRLHDYGNEDDYAEIQDYRNQREYPFLHRSVLDESDDENLKVANNFSDAKPCPISNQILQQLPFECKNTRFGCKEILMAKEILEHEKNCLYRAINCPVLNCFSTDLAYLSLNDHIEKCHKDGMKCFENKLKIQIKIGSNLENGYIGPPTKIDAFNRSFFEVGLIKNGFMYRWVYFLGSVEEERNFQYKVILKHGNGKVISTEENVSSLDSCYKTIVENDDKIFSISVKKLKQIMGPNNTLYYTIELRDLKEEAKDDDEESGISDNEFEKISIKSNQSDQVSNTQPMKLKPYQRNPITIVMKK